MLTMTHLGHLLVEGAEPRWGERRRLERAAADPVVAKDVRERPDDDRVRVEEQHLVVGELTAWSEGQLQVGEGRCHRRHTGHVLHCHGECVRRWSFAASKPVDGQC